MTRCLPRYDTCGECFYECVPDPPRVGQFVGAIQHVCIEDECRDVASVHPHLYSVNCYGACVGHLVFPTCVRHGDSCETRWPEGAEER